MRTDGMEIDCPACGQPFLLPSLESATYTIRCLICEYVFTHEDLLLGKIPANRFGMDNDI